MPRHQKDGDGWRHDENGNLIQATGRDGTPLVYRQIHESTAPNIEVRIGGLYALERIAQDSMANDGGRDHIRIMEILCAYVRENASASNLTWTEPPFKTKTPRTDIQAATTILGRRSNAQCALEAAQHFRLDLHGADLDGCDFRRSNFSAARFYNSRFEGAHFDQAKLHGTQFQRALLNFATFWRAELVGTNFDYAVANQSRGPLDAPLTFGAIRGISVIGADLSAIDFPSEADEQRKIFVSADTLFDGGTQGIHPEWVNDLRKLQRMRRLAVARNDAVEIAALDLQIENLGTALWSPYTALDLATPFLREKFLKALGLTSWPYQEPD